MGTRLAIILSLVGLTWLTSVSDDWHVGYFRGSSTEPDYYNLLIDGFRDGHTRLKQEPDPRRWSDDPAERDKSTYMLDVSLFERHHYLYFGVVPAVALFLPFSILTGYNLPSNVATLVLTAGGFIAAAATYGAARKRHFPRVGPVTNFLILLLLGFGSLGPVLIRRSNPYEIAISGGYCCAGFMFYCLFRHLHARRQALGWLALASLAGGLAVGSRPNLLLTVPVVGLAAFATWRHRRDVASRLGWRRLVLATILPGLAVGIGLGAYNYARFRNPLEFGFNYQINPFFGSGSPLMHHTFVWPNLKWYLLTPPSLSLLFPYVYPIFAGPIPPMYQGFEHLHGGFVTTLLLIGVGLAGIAYSRRLANRHRLVLWFLGMLGFAALTMLVYTISLAIRAERYAVNFQAALVLLLAIAGGSLSAAGRGRGVAPATWTFGFAALSVVAIFQGFFGSIQLYDEFQNTRRPEFERLARTGDYPADALQKAGLIDYGPIRMVFSVDDHDALGEAMLVTGTPTATDVVNLYQLVGHQGQFAVIHEGTAGFWTPPFPLEPGHAYELEIDLGSLYPPARSRAFDGWPANKVAAYKSLARIKLDGVELMRASLKFSDSSPGWVSIGENRAGRPDKFDGKILSVERLPWRTEADVIAPPETGVWSFDITYPWAALRDGQPILGSGTTGAGNLLFVAGGFEPNTLRFGLDSWGNKLTISDFFHVVNQGTGVEMHRLEIFAGSQVARQKLPAEWNLDPEAVKRNSSVMRVWWDGSLVMSAPLVYFGDTYDAVSVGSNPQGFSSAASVYTGQIKRRALSPAETRDFILRNLRD